MGEIVLGQRGSLTEVDVVQVVGRELTAGKEVFGSKLTGDCNSVSNAAQKQMCERFLQVREEGEGGEEGERGEGRGEEKGG